MDGIGELRRVQEVNIFEVLRRGSREIWIGARKFFSSV